MLILYKGVKYIKGKYLFKLSKSGSDLIINLLNKIIIISPHKNLDYEIWKEIITLVIYKEHLTSEGYDKVIKLKSKMHIYTKITIN